MNKLIVGMLAVLILLCAALGFSAAAQAGPKFDGPVVVFVEYAEGIVFKHIVLSDGTHCILAEANAGALSAQHSLSCKIK